MQAARVMLASLLLVCAGLEGAAAQELILGGPGSTFHAPQASDDGVVVVAQRREATLNCIAGCFQDVVVFDLSESCGNDVVRELLSSTDPEEWLREPSVTADGETVAYWIKRPDGFHFERVSTDGGVPEEIHHDATATTVESFDLSPTGDHAAYVRSIAGSMKEVVLLDLQAGPPASIAWTDAASSVKLNAQRPLTDGGKVFYAMSDALGVNVYSYDPVTATMVGETASLDTHGPPSTDRQGTRMAWLLTSNATGMTNVLVKTLATGMSVPLTSTTSAAWGFQDPALSPGGERVAFFSSGDHVGGANPDGSWEVFRATTDGVTLEQVTDADPAIDTPQPGGVSLASGGSILVEGTGWLVERDVVTLHSLDIPLPPFASAALRGVVPPFDVVTFLPDDPGLACTTDASGVTTCEAYVRNSKESDLELLVLVEWDVQATCPGLLRRQPRHVKIAAGERVFFSDELSECPSGSGTFRVTAVDADTVQADQHESSIAFP